MIFLFRSLAKVYLVRIDTTTRRFGGSMDWIFLICGKKGGVGMDTDEILEGMMVVFARREARSAYRCAIR